MSEAMRMWVEISFDLLYLLVVWGLVTAMIVRRERVQKATWPTVQAFLWAFVLLALGDTGHVGFRVWAYALGDLGSQITLFGKTISLVGIGALATAITVTIFYVWMVVAWKRRFQRKYGWFAYLLFLAAGVRLLLFLHPGNAWNQVVPPFDWSLYRNVPLIVQGLGVAYLIWRDASARQDRIFRQICGMILLSYACYAPVILFVQKVPMIGMLMIPKTIAYVAIAVIAYRGFYGRVWITGNEQKKLIR
jgi:hypothetical protein